MPLKTYLSSLFKCPSPAPLLPPPDSPSFHVADDISGETMCGGHQRTLSNRRLPSSQSKPTAVDRQKDFSINYWKRLPEPPKSNNKEKLKKESVRCLHVVSPKPAFACKHAPAHLSTRQITSVGRPRTSTPSAPHVRTNFAWFQSYSTRNLRTRSGHPPEVASQLMHPTNKRLHTSTSTRARRTRSQSQTINLPSAAPGPYNF